MPSVSFRPQHPELLQHEEIQTSQKHYAKSAVHASKRKEQRRVHFKETISVRPVRHVNNICAEEIKQVWYNKSEYDQMKHSIVITVKMISGGIYDGDNEEHCARGLECRTRVGALRRKENKLNAIYAVLDEQDRQIEFGIYDDELIREVYIDENLHSRLSSLEMGLKDRDEARLLDIEEDEALDCSDESERRGLLCRAPNNQINAKSTAKKHFYFPTNGGVKSALKRRRRERERENVSIVI